MRNKEREVESSSIRFEAGFASEREEHRILAWLNAGLRPDRPGRLQREYPLLFTRDSRAIPITAYAGHLPVAFCTLWPTLFSIGQGTLRMGLISLVYTAPSHRGRGYASATIQRAMAEARTHSLGCIALWSDLDEFYAGLGFRPSGCETLLSFSPELLGSVLAEHNASQERLDIETSAPMKSDWLAIERIRSQRDCTTPLPLDPTLFEAIPDMHVCVARRDHRIVAFAIRGRGDDFAGVIHEWGGETAAALLCCQSLISTDPLVHSPQLLCGKGRTDLTWTLRAAGASIRSRALAWFRLADCAAFATDLAHCLGLKNAWTLTVLERENDSSGAIRIRSKNSEITIDLQHFLDACFGGPTPSAQKAALEAMAPLIEEAGSHSLPLPFFISGLESI